MSHIEISILNEYADGALDDRGRQEVEAHLQGCDECSARLEEVRGLARRASTLLAELEPEAGAPPDFAELEARARARSGGSGQPFRWSHLAWAASVAFAFAMGHLVSTETGSDLERALTPEAQTPREVLDPALPSSAVASDEAPASPADRRTVESPVAGEGAPREGALGRSTSDLRQDRQAEPEAEAFADAGEEAAPAPAPAALERNEEARLQAAASKTAAREAEADADVAQAGAERGAAAGALQILAEVADDAAGPSWVDALSPNQRSKDAALAYYRSLDARQRDFVQGAAAALAIATDATAAEGALGGALRTLPDLTLSQIDVLPGVAIPGGTLEAPAVRLTYGDASGQTIILLQQREAEGERGPGRLTISPSGMTAYSWRDDAGYRLILIGLLSGDSLRALSDRVR